MCRNYFQKRKNGKRGRTAGVSGEDENDGPDQKETNKFLGVKQADGIKTKEVYNTVKEEVIRRL